MGTVIENLMMENHRSLLEEARPLSNAVGPRHLHEWGHVTERRAPGLQRSPILALIPARGKR